MRTVSVARGQEPVCLAQVAENPWTRARGLLGRHDLGEGEGLWIKPCRSVHTFFMRYPIDVVYLSREGAVLKTCRLPLFRLSAGPRGAHSVLELKAGTVGALGLRRGDALTLLPVDDRVAAGSVS